MLNDTEKLSIAREAYIATCPGDTFFPTAVRQGDRDNTPAMAIALKAIELAQSLSPIQDGDVVERVAPFEEITVSAYQTGWDDCCQTMNDLLAEGETAPLTPHKDFMSEGCGTFMSEAWPKLAASLPNRGVAGGDLLHELALIGLEYSSKGLERQAKAILDAIAALSPTHPQDKP